MEESLGIPSSLCARQQEARSIPGNLYKHEECYSIRGYTNAYNQPLPVVEQLNRLDELFPDIGRHNPHALGGKIPEGAEGFFLIPRWQSMAGTYLTAVNIVLQALKRAREGKFSNFIAESLSFPGGLSERASKKFGMMTLCSLQAEHKTLIVPAQFGKMHRGQSPRRAWEVMRPNEFGLGVFEVAMMLLTHPKRLQFRAQDECELWIYCLGDIMVLDERSHPSVPAFGFDNTRLRLVGIPVNHALTRYGGVSGFY